MWKHIVLCQYASYEPFILAPTHHTPTHLFHGQIFEPDTYIVHTHTHAQNEVMGIFGTSITSI